VSILFFQRFIKQHYQFAILYYRTIGLMQEEFCLFLKKYKAESGLHFGISADIGVLRLYDALKAVCIGFSGQAIEFSLDLPYPAPMKCPSCATRLREVKSRMVLIDVCPKCAGVWFDSGEFVDFVRSLTEDEEILPMIPRLFQPRQVHALTDVEEPEKICPRCDLPMRTFNYASDSNVFLDKCPSCNGLWADAGEVRQVARHLKVDPNIKAITKDIAQTNRSFRTMEDLAQLGKALRRPVNPMALFLPKIIVPLSDDAPRQKTPVLTIAIITLCTTIFAAQALTVDDLSGFFARFGFVPERFADLGLISSIFLHAGVLHLIPNMFFFWIFGDNVEDRFSRLGFIFFFLACGILACLAHGLVHWGSSIPVIGASGAISGVMGAYCVFYPAARVRLFFIYTILHLPAWLFLGVWLLLQLVFASVGRAVGCSNVAWFAHISGFVFGAMVAYFRKKMIRSK
jgi:membrane associated rhomboid family serine protease